MTSQSEMLTAEQRTPKTPITIDINKIRKEVEAICGKRIAIWLKKLPAALNRSKIENEIRWVEQIRCKWRMKLDQLCIIPRPTASKAFAEAFEQLKRDTECFCLRAHHDRVSDPESLRGESQQPVPRKGTG